MHNSMQAVMAEHKPIQITDVVIEQTGPDGAVKFTKTQAFVLTTDAIPVFAELEFPETGEIRNRVNGHVWMTAFEAAKLPNLYRMTKDTAAKCAQLVDQAKACNAAACN